MKTDRQPDGMNQEKFYAILAAESRGSRFTVQWAVAISKVPKHRCRPWLLELERGGLLEVELIRGAGQAPMNLYRVL